MSEHDLLPYWPRQQDVVACIKSEAEAASEWVALAVHQPMRFVPRVIGAAGASLDDCDEHALLRAFLTEDLPEGRMIVPIVGQSGVGKSHVIRWLDTHLRGLPDAHRRVVIRIPKGVSLREVLRLLLEHLPEGRYGHYRDELERAQHELDSREASGLLCEMLAYALEEMGREARERRQARPDDAEAKEREAYCSVFPTLLRSQYLRDKHFLTARNGNDGPMRRLVEHLTTPRSPGLDDDRKHGFVAEDLDFGDLAGDDELGRQERQAITFIRADRRGNAARILNMAIDDAKQRLLRIGPSTIPDLFNSIRRDLFADQKELVLLVEDFVVLSGLQKQLLQVIIKEAVRDGIQVLCTMRTALAYTAGYLDADTVLTRAHIEYRIPDDSPSEEEIFVRIERLVGSYLNAARLGHAALEHAYKVRHDGSNPAGWIPKFAIRLEPDAQATLEAFDRSGDGYELFPLNQSALRQLAREGCIRNGALVYNPRFVIQNVLNAVLIHRSLFEARRFPPPSFGSRNTQIGADVTEHVRRVVPDADLDRHLRFLAYWAGRGGAGQVSPKIVDAFSLKLEAITGPRGGESFRRTSSSPSTRIDPVQPAQQQAGRHASEGQVSPLEAKWDRTLEEWRRGASLGQRDADMIRRLVFEAARSSIDWDWFLHRPRLWADKWAEKQKERLYIPCAAGGEGRTAKDAVAVICTDGDLQSEAESARVKLALMGLVRLYLINKDASGYDGIEKDLAAAGALVERVGAALRLYIEHAYFGVVWEPAPLLVQGLLIGARVLGVAGADREDAAALTEAIFATAPADLPSGGAENSSWSDYAGALARCRAAKGSGDAPNGWTMYLLDLIAARQGGADKIHAIDASCLKPIIEDSQTHWSHTSQPPRGVVAGAEELDKVRGAQTELRRLATSVDSEREALVAWRKRCADWMGVDFDKNEILRRMKEAAENAHDAGLSRTTSMRGFNAALDAFRGAAVKTALDDIDRLSAEDRGVTLMVLARRYAPAIAATNALMFAYDAFEASVVAEIEGAQMTKGADPMGEAVAALQAELVKAGQGLGELHGDD